MRHIVKIEQSDLIGKIANFPIEVVQKMLERQIEQTNKADVSIFQKRHTSNLLNGGFDWDNTEDGFKFWKEVINKKNFRMFFVNYPKKVYIKTPSEEEVCGMDVIHTLEKYGGINNHEYIGDQKNCIYYIGYNNTIEMCENININIQLYNLIEDTYEEISVEEYIIEVTAEDIAKMLGVEVSKIRIKK